MLPFTAEILFSSFEQYNRALWPAQLVALVLALAGLALTLRPSGSGDRALGALLAAAWLWVGVGYHFRHLATIDFGAPLYGALFVVQGLLLAISGALRGRLAFGFRAGLSGWAGLLLALAALLAWPLADALSYGWPSARTVGLAPGPTAVFTVGLLLLIDGRTPWHLTLIPLLWTLAAGGRGWILGIPQDLALPVAGLAALVLILSKNRRQRRPRAPRSPRQAAA